MSEQHLPVQISPFKLARQRQVLQGVLSVKTMDRLAQAINGDSAEIAVDMSFDRNEQGINFARGHLSTEVEMICQRCLQLVKIPLEVDISIGFVSTDEQASQLPQGLEPCIIQDEPVSLAEIVEDELILALPIVAMHTDQSCEPVFDKLHEEAKEIKERDKKPNPFAVLSQLKR